MKEGRFEKEADLPGIQIKQLREGTELIKESRKSGAYQEYYDELRKQYREEEGPESYKEIFDIDLKIAMDDILTDHKLSDKAKWELIKDYREIEVNLGNRNYEDVKSKLETIVERTIGPMIKIHPENYKDIEALSERVKHIDELKKKGDLPSSGKFYLLGTHAKRLLMVLKNKMELPNP